MIDIGTYVTFNYNVITSKVNDLPVVHTGVSIVIWWDVGIVIVPIGEYLDFVIRKRKFCSVK
ncbi:MAG: hypothetical protein SVY15_02455 [Halobacteriota archaeon]|nr:hypothetical protein [Halobacteriota archaeon]